MNERQFFQNFGGRGADFFAAAAGRLQIELVEKNFGELLGRFDVEFKSGRVRRCFFRGG